ncbi:MAG TPA: hypothetical protein PLC55_12300, partial [Zoogloea sp.]|nr:hypothetical protein [Zoogloea sp.]
QRQTCTNNQSGPLSGGRSRPALFAVCNRIIVLDKGRIVADGPKEEILSTANHLAGNAGKQ